MAERQVPSAGTTVACSPTAEVMNAWMEGEVRLLAAHMNEAFARMAEIRGMPLEDVEKLARVIEASRPKGGGC